MIIKTQHINPPIPSRQFDWVAWSYGDETLAGYGRTEQEAIVDLKSRVDFEEE